MPVFLFTDIENSTRLWEKYPTLMGAVLARHDAILRREIERYGGRIIKHTGDGVFAVFERGRPLHCALEVQKALAQEDWGEVRELRIRIALHAGEALCRGEDYFGPTVNRTAR
ncbi:MAG: adenylate/guanylate cyclase domain-containing protein, partial [Chloroflexia bacterium]